MLILVGIIAAGVVSILLVQKDRRDAQAYREKKLAAIRAEQEAKEEAARQELEAKRAQDLQRRAAWDAEHGRLVIPIAGVTFDNEDGTSRQKILRDLKVTGGEAHLDLEEYEFKGAPAIRVLVNDMCVGNVPKNYVAQVSAVLDRLENGRIDIEKFHPEDEDEDGRRRGSSTIYRADLILVYSKNVPTLGT